MPTTESENKHCFDKEMPYFTTSSYNEKDGTRNWAKIRENERLGKLL